MMSDFMLPIYLATNKIQRDSTDERELQKKAQLKIEPREACGWPKQTRERQS